MVPSDFAPLAPTQSGSLALPSGRFNRLEPAAGIAGAGSIARAGRISGEFGGRLAVTVLFVLTIFGQTCAGEAASDASQPEALTRFAYGQVHMGSLFRITLYAPDKTTAVRASTAAFKRIAELDRVMSDYNPQSELMRLCRDGAIGQPISVSQDLATVLSTATEITSRSEGAFDITVGPVTRLWRVARKQKRLPDAEKLREALARVGPGGLQVDLPARTVTLRKSGIQLDLGGIAKGFACDAALTVLQQHGITIALIDGGGDIVAGDPPPNKDAWRVGVAKLRQQDEERFDRIIAIANAAVATSGDVYQHVVIDGTRYSHIANPRTGLGLTRPSSVTVLAGNGMVADAWASAVSVLGPDRGLAIVESLRGMEARIVFDDDGDVRSQETDGFRTFRSGD